MSQDRILDSKRQASLPKLQLFILYLIQLTEPITATVVFPFVNQFVRDTGITGGDERKTGYYAGFIVTVRSFIFFVNVRWVIPQASAFFLSEGLVVFHWGWLSDRMGRRPVLLLGPIGLSFAMLGFGVSTDFWIMVASRCAQGVFNGNIGVAKTVIAEITDPTKLADAYAMMPLVWSLGSTLGPILGGILADPAKRWPNIFGKMNYFTRHPYFLPCAAAGFSALIISLIAILGLKESLPSALAKRKQKGESTICVESSLLDNDTPTYGSTDLSLNRQSAKIDTEPPVPFRGLLIRQVLIPLLVYTFLAFVDMSMQVLMPLVYSTSISLGGLGFDAYRIGSILSVFGFVSAFVQFFFLGKLVRRFGPRNLLALTQLSNAVNIGLYPILSFFARRAGRADGIVWTIIVLQLISRLTNGMGWGSIQILIVDSAPNRASLGATNGMGQAVGCIARSVGPSVASSLFSLSLERNLVGGNLVFFVLVGFAFLGLGITFMLPQKLRSQTN